MMLKLTEIRQWIASLAIAEDQHVYIGKLDNKQQKSIGVYGRNGSGSPGIALGGLECKRFESSQSDAYKLLVDLILSIRTENGSFSTDKREHQ